MESPVFRDGEGIPQKYTCDGENISPPLRWTDAPTETRSFVLVVEDLDVPFGLTLTHWIVYNIPFQRSDLPEGIPKQQEWNGMGQGKRFGGLGCLGPRPPGKKIHRYYFRLFALETDLDLAPGASRREIMRAIAGRIIAAAELMGTYERLPSMKKAQ